MKFRIHYKISANRTVNLIPIVHRFSFTIASSRILDKLVIVVELGLIGLFLYWHWRLGMTRYFDIDEFAHLHWTHDFFSGLKPYTDFFYFIPPLYLFALLPLFFISGRSAAIFFLGRGLAFGIFFVVCLLLFLLVRKIRDSRVALLSVLILSFLPIPADKWIEIRPDGLAILFGMAGMLFLVKGLKEKNNTHFFISGLFYSLGVLVLPKIVFWAFCAAIIIAVYLFINQKKIKAGNFIKYLSDLFTKFKWLKLFILGVFIPIVLVAVLFVYFGDPGKAFYLSTKIAADATKILGDKFPIPPNFLFYPNDVYYGAPGESWPWKMNLFVWIAACVWAIVKLVSFLDRETIEEGLSQLLPALSFLLYIIAYIYIFPLRHEQYLLPASIFVAFYFADFVISFFRNLRKRWKRAGSAAGAIVFAAVLLVVFWSGKDMYDWKLRWPSLDATFYNHLFSLIPKNEKVFDLTGEAVFSPDGYYFCCIPYGQYDEALQFQYPDLEAELRRQNVHFVYMQRENRIFVLPPEQQKVIRQYYTIYPDGNPSFLLVSGALVNFSYAGQLQDFNLIASGKYDLLWNYKKLTSGQASRMVKIDGKIVTDDPVYLSAGEHTIVVNSSAGLMKLMYSF